MSADLESSVQTTARRAREAAVRLAALRGDVKVAALVRVAAAIRADGAALLDANAKDIAAAQEADLAPALIERLKLNDKRIESMADGVEQIAAQVDPVGADDRRLRPPQRPAHRKAPRADRRRAVLLRIAPQRHQRRRRPVPQERQRRHPARRQGSVSLQPRDRRRSSQPRSDAGTRPTPCSSSTTTDRALVPILLKLDKYIDLVIPRGGESLIRAVVARFDHPRAQALHRQLPHLRRCRMRGDGAAGPRHLRQRQDELPRRRGLQRGRAPAVSQGCRAAAAAQSLRGSGGKERRDSRR